MIFSPELNLSSLFVSRNEGNNNEISSWNWLSYGQQCATLASVSLEVEPDQSVSTMYLSCSLSKVKAGLV